MTPVPDLWSIVLAGVWNPAVFSPQWITNDNLTAAKGLEVRFDVSNPRGSLEFNFDGIRLLPSGNRVQLKPASIEPPNLQTLSTVADRILSKLPETPVSAVGFNFGFEDPQPAPEVLTRFRLSDDDRITDAGWAVEGRQFKRTLRKEQETINLVLELTPKASFKLSYNFHYKVQTAAEAKAIIQTSVTTRLDAAKALYRILFSSDLL